MKASEQYFPVVLFIMLYKVVLSFESPQLGFLDKSGECTEGYSVLRTSRRDCVLTLTFGSATSV